MFRWSVTILLAAVTALACAAAADAQGQLVARLETESHQGGVTEAAADRTGRIVVTQGVDGTARVWSLPDLRLLRVLRAPLGASLQQIAIAPDGTFVAAASGTFVLVFDLASGEIIGRIPVRSTIAVENHLKATPVNTLAISPDGSRIAIGRGDNDDGCWLYIVRLDGTEVNHQCNAIPERVGASFKEFTFAMAFGPDGRLAVATSGGGLGTQERHTLTLLDSSGNITRTAAIPGWVWFKGLAFSPDGKRVAVAHWGRGPVRIEVRDATTLAVLATPASDGLSGFLPTLAWNAHGTTLFASGYHVADARLWEGDPAPVYAWDESGAGARRQAALGGYFIASVVPLPDDRILMITNNRNLEVADRSGSILSKNYPDGVDLRVPGPSERSDDGFRLRVSRDGSQVEFVMLDAPNRWLHVDARNLTVTQASTPQSGLDDWTVDGARFTKGSLEQAMLQEQKDRFERPGGSSEPGAWFFNEMKPYVQQRLQNSPDPADFGRCRTGGHGDG
jgi:WD40 repeat protein